MPQFKDTLHRDWWSHPRPATGDDGVPTYPEGFAPTLLAGDVTRVAAAIENANFQMRWRNTVYARLASGMDIPMSFGLSMTRRVGPLANQLRSTAYVEPYHNVCELAVDTFRNRIGTNKPWVVPQTNGGDSDLQTHAEDLRDIIAAQFDKANLYRDVTPICFDDMATWGTMVAKVAPDLKREQPEIKRVLCDDILINETEASVLKMPRMLIHREYVFRDDLLSMFEDDEDAAHAIMNAPSAFSGVTNTEESSLDNIIYLLDAYKLPRANGDAGRRVYCLPNFIFSDTGWTRDHFPFAFGRWKRLPVGFWGKGVPASLYKIQQNIDRLDRTIISQQTHGSVFTILNRKGSGLVSQHFANKQGRVLGWDLEKPEFIAPQSVNPEIYQERNAEIQQALNFIGLSPQITSGARDPGVTAGVAIRAKENQADARHLSPGQTLEQFVVDIAYLLLETDKEIKPELSIAGKVEKVNWDDYTMTRGDVKIMAFPVSSVPSEPEGKLQQVSEWFADGQINKQEKMLLDGMPDTRAYEDIATSMQRYTHQVLDRIVKTGRMEAPDAYENWETVIQIAQSKLKQEQARGTSQDRLRLIEQWIDLCFDMAKNPTALPQPVGITPPAAAIQDQGQAPAAPPLQVAPSQAAPAQMGAPA